jgi:NAD(P)-dependent dehydrogenase (short-subunit alcohol dehydrogenase family)
MSRASKPARRPGRLVRTAAAALSRLLDPTIVMSFDRSGFLRHAINFDPADLDVDLTGRTCLVTGGNSGIGYATAAGLAQRGATVWLLCRNPERGEYAVRRLRAATGSRRVHCAVLDVADFTSIRRFAKDFGGRSVDVLVHNAGVLPDRREETADGNELTLATNVLGPLLLTRLLLPKLRAAGRARVVFVSSGGMYTQRLSVADAQWKERPFDGVAAYAQTKRMQVVLAETLARRLAADGVVVHAMHPGWADTPAVRTSLPRFHAVTRLILRTPEQGADTVLWLAASAAGGRSSGCFWFDRASRPTHLLKRTRETDADRRAFWAFCAERVPGLRSLAEAASSAP